MDHFTPVSALIGGAFIGIACGLLIIMNGRIAGISGIFGNLFTKPDTNSEWLEKLVFILGLILGPLIIFNLSDFTLDTAVNASWPLIVIAGVLVGFGTRLGSGCTSGHGICGLSRLSKRSLVATLCFMATGFAVVLITKHLLG